MLNIWWQLKIIFTIFMIKRFSDTILKSLSETDV